MLIYAKLTNNKLNYAPKDYNTSKNLIINFNKNKELMKKHGFKEVIDIRPEYDNNLQYLSIDGYTEDENTITIQYKVNEIVIDNTPTIEERVTKLEKLSEEQFNMIKEMSLLMKASLKEKEGE